MEEEGAPWELLYNLGTALVQRGGVADDAAAESCLEQAAEVCKEVRAPEHKKQLFAHLQLIFLRFSVSPMFINSNLH